MQFFGVNKEEYSLVYVIENPYNNTLTFDTEDKINFIFNHEFPLINEDKEYGFRIYVADKDVTDISKIYRNYLIEMGNFKTLKEKEKINIKKLYGAPHVYFWNSVVIGEDNIKWAKLKNNFPEDLKSWIQKLLNEKVEDGKELANAFDELNKEEYVAKYVKNNIIKGLSEVVKLREFYNEEIFETKDKEIEKYLEKGIDNLNEIELIDLNKRLLKSKLSDMVDPVEKWGDSLTLDVLEDMKNSGLSNLWIGFDDWRAGFIKPEFVDMANEYGYLIGTYDSYHSIHKPGQEQWITAKFEDETLFENATVTNKNGKKIEGFNGVVRKLNSTLAMPSVKNRVNKILDTGIDFNSWFLDTDGTGEVYDDYSKEHITTEKQDIEARMLYEVLYNIPPLYHLDKEEWEKHKDTIVNHSKVWSDFSKKVINKEMTKFEKLSDNVQITQYGEDIKVIANFSDEIYEYENKKIKSKSLLIIDGENIYEYIPKA